MNVRIVDLHDEASRVSLCLQNAPHLQQAALATWHGRMVSEYASHRVFEGLAAQSRRAQLPEMYAQTFEEFAQEERHHGVLCGAVVQSLGGQALVELRDDDVYPVHEDVSPLEGFLRNLISVSCLSETFSVALIGAERALMRPGSLRDVLTRIWSDEIGHARFGWKLLQSLMPTLDDASTHRLDEYLVVAFEHLEQHELGLLPITCNPPLDGAHIGLTNGLAARKLFYETMDGAILPGLAALGLHAYEAWEGRTAFSQVA